MSYVEKLEVVINDLKTGKIDKYSAGVESEQIIMEHLDNGEELSCGEYIAIEEELNPLGTSIYEDKYYELQEKTKK